MLLNVRDGSLTLTLAVVLLGLIAPSQISCLIFNSNNNPLAGTQKDAGGLGGINGGDVLSSLGGLASGLALGGGGTGGGGGFGLGLGSLLKGFIPGIPDEALKILNHPMLRLDTLFKIIPCLMVDTQKVDPLSMINCFFKAMPGMRTDFALDQNNAPNAILELALVMVAQTEIPDQDKLQLIQSFISCAKNQLTYKTLFCMLELLPFNTLFNGMKIGEGSLQSLIGRRRRRKRDVTGSDKSQPLTGSAKKLKPLPITERENPEDVLGLNNKPVEPASQSPRRIPPNILMQLTKYLCTKAPKNIKLPACNNIRRKEAEKHKT